MQKNNSNLYSWKSAAASIVGFDHIASDLPCQDAYAVAELDDGIIICVVCDGAGSAKNAELGSRLISESIVRNLAQVFKIEHVQDHNVLNYQVIKAHVTKAIEKILNDMKNIFCCDVVGLSDFHSTLVGVVASTDGGIFFHIGDGCAFSSKFSEFNNCIISLSENGEYANETFFVTQENWREHLRFTTFGADFDYIVLMSDGVTPFALSKGGEKPFENFFNPLNSYLIAHNNQDSIYAIKKYLQDERIRNITGDDKTFVWISKKYDDNEIGSSNILVDK